MSVHVYELDEGEAVGCYFCAENGNHASYQRGEAYLAGADHSPHDASANYVCRRHLDAGVVIVDLATTLTILENAK